MKKILITYASYGGGHKTIIEYIKTHLEKNEDYEIKVLDILDYTGKFCNATVKFHNYMYSHRMEYLFSTLYKLADNKLIGKLYNVYFKKVIMNRTMEYIYTNFSPDLVLSSHFFGSNIAYNLKKQGKIDSKIMTIITDYKAHDLWMSNKDEEEVFIVANEIVKREMIKKGCYSSNIYPFGLPYNIELFNSVTNNAKTYEKYNISKNKKVILFFGGGSNGSEAYLKYFKELLKLDINMEVLFVCGRNKILKETADDLVMRSGKKNIHVLGFVSNVYELLNISSLVITKPGGATVTECLETKKIMMLLPGVGGQEEYNAKFVKRNNHGFTVRFLPFFRLNLMRFARGSYIFKKYEDSYKDKNKNESLDKICKLINDLLK